ncbi:PH domain-containing protein [Nocardiopsis sp. RSe5-2]|uniref:PH domain-containing protein n=1 Tax=Nocardiopsis endophytica TaxID=3018445 RepID=A0ABT4UBN5_9ACTN|nr:PH domain-containing protein [Nocardiopsis endophytica]MDA2814397.1 PH domain-containing protein [Nocardiopsis endophytica]
MSSRLRPPQHRVSPRAVPMWTLGSAVGHLVTAAVLGFAAWGAMTVGWSWIPDWVSRYAWWVPAVYAVYGVVETAVVPRFRFRVHRWEVTEDVIYTRKGWIGREWQLVPISRIQTVDHTQGWFERMFRVATLEVQTASHAGSSTIEGLDADQAREISEDLAVRAGELRDDAT